MNSCLNLTGGSGWSWAESRAFRPRACWLRACWLRACWLRACWLRAGRVAAVIPAVQGRLDGLGRGGHGGGFTGVRVPPGSERLGRVVPLAVRVPGIHVVHRSAPDRDPDRTYGQQQTPAAGCRPAFDQAPLRQAMSTRCRIVPATLPQRATGRTSLKTSVSVCETLFLSPSGSGLRCAGPAGTP